MCRLFVQTFGPRSWSGRDIRSCSHRIGFEDARDETGHGRIGLLASDNSFQSWYVHTKLEIIQSVHPAATKITE